MKLHRQQHLGKIGIYCIRNLVNNKVYVGKSKNIYLRLKQHITQLNTKNKNENPYLIKSWHKHGKNNFEYFVLEYFDNLDENFLKQRELYWIDTYKSINRQFGYNLRRDSSTNMIVHEETKEKLKNSRKLRDSKFPHLKEQVGKKSSKFWKNNPDIKEEMKTKVSNIHTKYNIYQYDKQMNLIKIWNKLKDIIQENPTYKVHNIYAVCSGEKPSMYGYIWVKVKIVNKDIVQSSEKSELENKEIINPF